MTKMKLTQKELNLIRSVFVRHGAIERVVLFGSRAKGTARVGSDIDLAVFGLLDDLEIEALALELEELPLPYKFDVKAFENISYVPLREHIQRVGVGVYEK